MNPLKKESAKDVKLKVEDTKLVNIGVVPIPTGACNDRLALHFLAACGDTSCAGLSVIL